MNNITNPKYNPHDISLLYKYYAGFSVQFVLDMLKDYKISELTIMDPWNGSGTTSKIAGQLGAKEVYGFDINPVMNVIAAAELLSINEFKNVELNSIQNLRNHDIKEDPLEAWFTKTSVRNIRNVELEIMTNLLDETSEPHKFSLLKKELVVKNRLTAFYYLALFETVKRLTKKFNTSNPTWIKVAKNQEEKVKISHKKFEKLFLEELQSKKNVLSKRKKNISQNIILKTQDSRKIPLDDNSVDLTITSPPYCTRIDYAVATRVELAILGFSNDNDFEELRKEMIGTTKIIKNSSEQPFYFSNTAQTFMSNVYNHASKASKTYYYKQFSQYFDGISMSISELNRVSKQNSKIIIVVQDSFYKDIHLDIAVVFEEIFDKYGWSATLKQSFEKKQTMVTINNKTKNYRTISNPTETVLIFERR